MIMCKLTRELDTGKRNKTTLLESKDYLYNAICIRSCICRGYCILPFRNVTQNSNKTISLQHFIYTIHNQIFPLCTKIKLNSSFKTDMRI